MNSGAIIFSSVAIGSTTIEAFAQELVSKENRRRVFFDSVNSATRKQG
jgi:hypothetical protein